MADLIDRQAAIDAIHNADTQIYEGEAAVGRRNYMTKEECCEIIDSLPSAQPVIRCKDCKYWTHIKRTDRYWCKTDDGLYDLNPSPDDFCSRAERRSENADVNT